MKLKQPYRPTLPPKPGFIEKNGEYFSLEHYAGNSAGGSLYMSDPLMELQRLIIDQEYRLLLIELGMELTEIESV